MSSDVNYKAHRVSFVLTIKVFMRNVSYLKQLSESDWQGARHDCCFLWLFSSTDDAYAIQPLIRRARKEKVESTLGVLEDVLLGITKEGDEKGGSGGVVE